jgi:hypothetical protein
MKKLLYILFYITLISCNSKTEEIKEEVVVFSSDGTIIYESDVYEVINALFTDNEKTNILDGIDYSGELLSVYPNSDYIHTEELGMLDIVMEEDKDFIFKQVTFLNKYDLKQEVFFDFKIIPRVEIENLRGSWEKEFMDDLQNGITYNWEEFSNKFKKKYQKTDFYYITIPLFSKDKNTAIIVFGYQFIPHGGNGELYVYKKENNKWVRTKKGFSWLSS